MADGGQYIDPELRQPTGVRHLVVGISMLMAILLYLDRFCVSFAGDYIREDLGLTQQQMSWFHSAFFLSYALAQVPSGWLGDRYGARLILVIYILSWSAFTGLLGFAHTLFFLLLMRLGCGLGQAGAYPTCASLVSKWVPFSNRGTASAVISFGGRIGGAIAPLLTAWLMVLFVPMSVPVAIVPGTLLDAELLARQFSRADGANQSLAAEPALRIPPAHIHIWSQLRPDDRAAILAAAERIGPPPAGDTPSAERLRLTAAERDTLAAALNRLLDDPGLYDDEAFRTVNLPREAVTFLARQRDGEELATAEQRRLNRFLLEGAFRDGVGKLYVRGWRNVMFVYGLAGILVAGAFWIVFRNRPDEHPWCNQAERELIASGRPAHAPGPHGRPGMVPIGRLLSSRSMWFDCATQLGTNIGWVFLVTWMPRYLAEAHQVPILERGVMVFVPLAVGIFGVIAGGRLTDALVPAVGLKWGRRLPIMLTRFSAAAGYGLCIWLATLPPGSPLSSPWMFVAAFALVAVSVDMGAGAAWAFKQDVGGRYAGSVLGWGNMWGNLGAAAAPPIYNLVLGETPGLADWSLMFAVCMGALTFAGICAMGIDATIPVAPPDDEDDARQAARSAR